MSETPRNNLQEVLKRNKDHWTVQSPATLLAGSGASKSKFKPAASSTVAGISTVNVTVRRPVVATFSTPGFRSVTTTTTTTNVKSTALTSTPKANYAPEGISTSSDPPSPGRRSKRTSAEFAPMCDESPRSKRLRKENEPIEVVANNAATKRTKKFKPVPTGSQPKTAAIKQAKPSPIDIDDDLDFEAFISSKPRPVNQTASTSTIPDIIEPVDLSTPQRQHSSTLFGLGSGGTAETDIPLKHMDLLTEPQESLVEMLKQDNSLNKTIMDSIFEHHSKSKVVDLQILEHIQGLLNDRVKAITDVLKLRKASGSSSVASSSRFTSPMPGPIATGSSIRETVTRVRETTTTTYDASTSFSDRSLVASSSKPAETKHSSFAPPASEPIVIDDDDDDELWGNVGTVPYDDADFEVSEVVPISNTQQKLPPQQRHLLELAARQTPVSRSGTPAPADPRLQQSKYYPEVKEQLQRSFRLEAFRPNQLEAILAAMEGRDVFVLMPTGGGKSLCYQLPAVCQSGSTRGVTVVVSPLLALMKDQVESLLQKNIDTFLWNGDTSYEDVQNRIYRDPPPKLMYVTPEKLKESGIVNTYLSKLYQQKQLARFVIDEAHCISTWGQDFREAYQGLGSLRDSYPNTPMMALTATANQTTSDDIIHKLKMRNTALFQQSFNRTNLTYYIKEKKKNSVISDIVAYIKSKHYGKTGVIYCLGRDKCEFVADKLRNEGLKATHFHAKMLPDEKDQAMAAWMDGTCHIVVATIAFGMGIDKADVRFVIHHDLPKSIDGYYQETGRAGRDGLPADCVLFYNFADFKSIQRMIEAVEAGKPRPPKDVVDRQLTAARKVVEYCSNTVTCRRVLLLHYFGEVFESKNCKRHCDNCMNDVECLSQNVTDEAKCAVELVRSFREADEMVTTTQCREILRGAKTQDIQRKRHDRFAMYGKAAGLPLELLEQMIMRLLFMEVFIEVSMPTSSGFHASYVALGPKSHSFLKDSRPLMIEYRPKPSARGRKKAATTTTKVTTAKRGKKNWEIEDDIEDSLYMTD